MVAVTLVTARAGLTDEQYQVTGEDVYRVGDNATTTHVTYDGMQNLSVEKHGKETDYVARAQYTRIERDGKSSANAWFVQVLLPSGAFHDRIDEDPDFLTILNQPFAVQLDPGTMRDLRHLHQAVPFGATSPLGGDAVLRGYLRPGVAGEVAGKAAVAVRFEAEGPMSGPVPGDTQATMAGKMRMAGIAYYALATAMLVELDATLRIDARLSQSTEATPVSITYRRYIRALPEGASAKTPQPTPLATGGGTAALPTP